MARSARDGRIDTRTARLKLKPAREPYWAKLGKGCFLGYRRQLSGGGSWIARYRDALGRQQFKAIGAADDFLDANGVSALTFEQVQKAAHEWMDMAAAAHDRPRRRKAYTVSDCMADYLEYVRQRRKSYRHLDTYIKAYILPRIGHADTARLTTTMIRSWHAGIAAEPPRLRTPKGKTQRFRDEDPDPREAQRKRRLRANRHLVTLKAALTLAWKEGLIARNEAWTRVTPFAGVERQRKGFLTREQAKRLLNACPADLRQLVRLALLTGARYSELGQAKICDFHADAGTLFIADSKSGKSRHIVLNVEGEQFCKQLSAGRAVTERLLIKDDGGGWERDHHHRAFKVAVIRAGLDPKFTFHELRHTWASLTIMAGAPLMVVAQNLGHRDTRMVELHYGHLADSFVTKILRETAPSFGLDVDTNVVAIRSSAN